ncbi:polysaccharide export protein EpsE [Uliginosibacterium sp. H1]|uniref:polysaccharide export protein EpsE n=1 Tax=Uliginosibacterium sp. H1 TaxID=3114757 RepID=UPI002E196C72|nr:polysaccharide export protein EpsE [Uliginosibacterium sp. H1]
MTQTLSRVILTLCLLCSGLMLPAKAADVAATDEYRLSASDVVRITVFRNPDLTTEARVSETGVISFPLLGAVQVGGLSVQEAEAHIGKLLREGNLVLQPQVTILPVSMRGNQIAVLGQVNRPGRYPIEKASTRVSDMLANAGGVATTGSDVVTLITTRNGKRSSKLIDLPVMFQQGVEADEVLSGGDVIFVDRAPVFYIYGEVQRAGAYRLERAMSVMQGLATGGGISARGTPRGLVIHRRGAGSKVQVLTPSLDDPLQANDVIYVKEALF